jgi:hypothetical protein
MPRPADDNRGLPIDRSSTKLVLSDDRPPIIDCLAMPSAAIAFFVDSVLREAVIG